MAGVDAQIFQARPGSQGGLHWQQPRRGRPIGGGTRVACARAPCRPRLPLLLPPSRRWPRRCRRRSWRRRGDRGARGQTLPTAPPPPAAAALASARARPSALLLRLAAGQARAARPLPNHQAGAGAPGWLGAAQAWAGAAPARPRGLLAGAAPTRPRGLLAGPAPSLPPPWHPSAAAGVRWHHLWGPYQIRHDEPAGCAPAGGRAGQVAVLSAAHCGRPAPAAHQHTLPTTPLLNTPTPLPPSHTAIR